MLPVTDCMFSVVRCMLSDRFQIIGRSVVRDLCAGLLSERVAYNQVGLCQLVQSRARIMLEFDYCEGCLKSKGHFRASTALRNAILN